MVELPSGDSPVITQLNKDVKTKKKIVFLTGTRADFGKLKPLISKVEESSDFKAHIFATGMHMLPKYGTTAYEIMNCGFNDVYLYNNEAFKSGMDISLANTIYGFTCYIKEIKPDLIIIHGDRPEALAGAIVGAFNNIRVAHIEGGELSGTIDGLTRHSITKLAHAHLVSNGEAEKRLIQMGESSNTVFKIGSPEVDIMLSPLLPDNRKVKKYYEIPFKDYAIFIYHSVTTETGHLRNKIRNVVDALIESKFNYVVIMPNNDLGSDIIANDYKRLIKYDNFRIYPSIRFEFFLSLLKNSKFIIGNSSSGVREAPVYSIPSINIGSRQSSRTDCSTIINVIENKKDILSKILDVLQSKKSYKEYKLFGNGKSAISFMNILRGKILWKLPLQKKFNEI